MKIAITICEYNPFHNGHKYSLDEIRKTTAADAVVCVMSGNFTERGDIAVMHKYDRAKHAVLAGADVVIELPAVFATAPAEIFAKGGVKTAECLNGERTLCFGIESGDKSGLIATANYLLRETSEFKSLLKQELDEGVSFARARYNALEKLNPPGIDLGFTLSPNNILALEYTKAVIERGFTTDVLPIERKGAGYKAEKPDGIYFSASGIRQTINDGKRKKVSKYVPPYVFSDLPDKLPNADSLILYSLLTIPKKDLARITDCTEGLENRIKAMLKDCFDRKELIEKLSTKRYTSPRLSRITLAAMLGIDGNFVQKCLKSDLYLKVLAINKDKLDLLSAMAGKTPFIMRKRDADNLSSTARECFEKDVFANDVYNLVTNKKSNEFLSILV